MIFLKSVSSQSCDFSLNDKETNDYFIIIRLFHNTLFIRQLHCHRFVHSVQKRYFNSISFPSRCISGSPRRVPEPALSYPSRCIRDTFGMTDNCIFSFHPLSCRSYRISDMSMSWHFPLSFLEKPVFTYYPARPTHRKPSPGKAVPADSSTLLHTFLLPFRPKGRRDVEQYHRESHMETHHRQV